MEAPYFAYCAMLKIRGVLRFGEVNGCLKDSCGFGRGCARDPPTPGLRRDRQRALPKRHSNFYGSALVGI
jgi:hypothetical protein